MPHSDDPGCEHRGCLYFNHPPFRIHAHEFGAGPPLVLVHGFPECWASWQNQIEILAQSHRVIVPDLPGFNLSLAPNEVGAFGAAQVSEALLAFLSHLGIERFAIVGHDVGGVIAWWCAGAAPERVERLALLSSPHPADYIASRTAENGDGHHTYADLILANEDGELFRPERLGFWTAGTPAHAAHLRAMARSNSTAMGHYYRANLKASDRTKWLGLAKPLCPTALIYGEADPFIPLRYFEGLHLRSWEGVTRAKLAGAGHFLHSTAIARVNEELLAWLSRDRE